MAQETTTSISLQARDWENITTLINTFTDGDLKRLIINLQSLYNVVTPPQGGTLVSITTKEKTLIKIYAALYNMRNYVIYVGSNNLSRIGIAIKAANSDGYITTETAAIEAAYTAAATAQQNANRKAGREILMVDVLDNN